MNEITLKIEKLNEKGYGIGFVEGKEFWVLNALPGEEVKATLFKSSKGIKYGAAIEVLKSSNLRIKEKEEHFLSCSPWQILKIEDELKIKNDLIRGFYQEHVDFDLPEFEVVFTGNEYGYRNKMEFSFYGDDETNKISLAFHKRDGHKAKYCFENCVLTSEIVNESAQKIVDFINSKNLQARQFKGILTRYSKFEDKCVIAVYVKDESLEFDKDEVEKLLDEKLKGILINYSDHKSPAFVETKNLVKVGETDLVEKVLDLEFTYPYDGFFQINPEVFELAAKDIISVVERVDKGECFVADIYGGVGTIGLLLSRYAKEVYGVELFEKSLEYANKNAKNNKITNYSLIQDKAEKSSLEILQKSDVVVVDPPRSGLHPKLVKQILEIKPKTLIYLSCNPKTQAQDFNLLKENYEVKFFKAYDFYPHTPHAESLLILEVKS